MNEASPANEATATAALGGGTEARATPCRPYWPGEHARALRRRILTGLGVGFLAALIVPSVVRAALLVGMFGFTEPVDELPLVVRVVDEAGFAVTFFVAAWAWVGPRRWGAIEILVWGSRYAAEGYAAVTGIRDPADGAAAGEWLRATPASDDDPPEVVYWRAHAQFVSRDLAGARATVARLADRPDYRYAIASLEAQMAMAEGRVPDLAAVESALAFWTEPLARAIAAANLGALRAQHAWSCGQDDVGAALSVRPLLGGHASNFLLTRVWLPIAAVALAWTGLMALA